MFNLFGPPLGLRDPAAFIERYGLDATDESLVHHVTCGLHSGIPECCVLFFVTVWYDGKHPLDWPPGKRTYQQAMRRTIGTVNYVPCPGCLTRRTFIKTRRCRCLHPQTRRRLASERRATA